MPESIANKDRAVSGIIQKLDIVVPSATTNGKPDTRPEARPDTRPLQGLTFAVKDMFAVEGWTTGFGIPDWKSTHAPSPRHAPSVAAVLEAGAHLVANTVCDELAFSIDGINIHYGTPINPRDPKRIPGGSSSGPASVVAQGLVDFALGTDTAGSIRVPASYCGIWGLRPTHGSISCQDVLPLGPSFDTVGLLAGTLDVLTRVAAVLIKQTGTVPAKHLIIASDCFALLDPVLLPPVVALVDKLRRLFESSEDKIVAPDGLKAMADNFATIRSFEVWQCHGQWFEATNPDLSPTAFKRISGCRGTPGEEVAKSSLYRQALQVKFRDLLDQSVICLPTTANLPPLKTATAGELDTNRTVNLRLNSIASFLGLPQITIPVMPLMSGIPVKSGTPVKSDMPADQTVTPDPYLSVSSCVPCPGLSPGLSLIGAEGSEFELLRLAATLTY